MKEFKPRKVQRVDSDDNHSRVIATCVDDSGERLACAHTNGTVTFWRPKSLTEWEKTACFETPHKENSIAHVCFASPRIHHCLIATAGTDGIIVLLALSSDVHPQAIYTILKSRGAAPISSVSFSDSGILAARCGNTVNMYECDSVDGRGIDADACKWRHIADVKVDDNGDGVSFAPGTMFFVSGTCIVGREQGCHWAVFTSFDNDKNLQRVSSNVCCVHWGSAGFIAIATGDNHVQIWQLKRGELIRLADMSVEHTMKTIHWDRTGTILAGIDKEGFTSTFGRKYHDGKWQWARDHSNMKSYS